MLFDSRGWVFGVKLSDEDIAEIECLRVVAMTTNFGTNIAISWLYVNDSDSAISNVGGFEWSADRMQILPIPCTCGTLQWQPFSALYEVHIGAAAGEYD